MESRSTMGLDIEDLGCNLRCSRVALTLGATLF
jgi:hypothetical protein